MNKNRRLAAMLMPVLCAAGWGHARGTACASDRQAVAEELAPGARHAAEATSVEAASHGRNVIGNDVIARFAVSERVRVLVFLASPEFAAGDLARTREGVAVVQDRVLSKLQASDFLVKRRFATIPAFAGEVTSAGLQRLAALAEVVRVDLDAGGEGHLAEAVPLINADDLRGLGWTGEGVTVAVLDSGLDTDHLDLVDDLDGQACFCSGGTGCCPNGQTTQVGAGAAEDDNGHGSNVAGIVTSRGRVAPIGVAPDARVVAIKVLDASNSFCCSSDIVAGLDWIINTRPDVDIVNMSLGTFALFAGNCDGAASYTLALASAINTLRARGTTTFASSGNNGSGTSMTAPACVANTISVGAVYDANVGAVTILGCTDATTAADKVTCFTNSNATTDIFAPGAPMTSDSRFGSTSTYYGTSQASPTCAGCAADLLEAYPMLTPAQIESALKTTGVPVVDSTNGLSFPRIDCLAALNSLTCVDADLDGFGSPGLFTCPAGSEADCNDSDPGVRPGGAQVCDGVNNDCRHPGWPVTSGTNEADDDADGAAECAGDCDDTDGAVWQTPGEAETLTVAVSGPATVLSWTAPVTGGLPSAMTYDVLRSDNAADFSTTSACFATNVGPGTTETDAAVPPAGSPFYYLVRAEDVCGVGPLGSRSDGVPRDGSPCP